jgi:AraC-like DNA-binding protein
MATAAEQLAAGPSQLARAFQTVFGIAPHPYVLGRRLDAARDRILGGQPLADVAIDVGFADQAHLTRRFKAYLGTTPGRFSRSIGPGRTPSGGPRRVPSASA